MTDRDPISVIFLRDVDHGGSADQLASTAEALAQFVSAAAQSVDIAIYDFRLSDLSAVDTVVTAVRAAAARGVTVRIGYDAGKPARADSATFSVWEADPAPPGTAEWVSEHFSDTTVQTLPVVGGHYLMHSKYVVRDAGTEAGCVWTGSTNFTDAAWTRQENNIITIADEQLANAYRADFDELWAGGRISGTARGSQGTDTVGAGTLGWDFCPGDGVAVNTAVAQRITDATQRVIVASMVLTSPQVLTALGEAIDRGVALSGIYDSGQMDPIVHRWTTNSHDAQQLATWEKVSQHLVAKRSAPYSTTGPHDFMHLKVMVSDDVLTTGSYNFSTNAEHNAENQLHLTDPTTLNRYIDYLTMVIETYR
jgi:phosphatidylserine/phosphatidylglycerophosphate/cardiolipin synthase-like enzyme